MAVWGVLKQPHSCTALNAGWGTTRGSCSGVAELVGLGWFQAGSQPHCAHSSWVVLWSLQQGHTTTATAVPRAVHVPSTEPTSARAMHATPLCSAKSPQCQTPFFYVLRCKIF